MFLSDPILNDNRHPAANPITLDALPVGSTFNGNIPDITQQEGAALNRNVSTYFSGSPSFRLVSSPSNPGISINSLTGIITGTPTGAGRYAVAVIATLNGIDTPSNVFGLTLTKAEPARIDNEPIEFEVLMAPADQDGRDNVIYRNNENAFIIPSVVGVLSGVTIDNPSISARLEELDGTLIENITDIETDYRGRHAGVLNEDASIDMAEEVRLVIEVSAATVGDGSMTIILSVEDRTE